MFTITEAAKYLGVAYAAFYRAVRTFKVVPEPTHTYGVSRRYYYSQDDLDRMKELVPLIRQKK